MLLRQATTLAEVDAAMAGDADAGRRSTEIVDLVPDAWLTERDPGAEPGAIRAAYARYLSERLEAPRAFVEEADPCPLRYTYDYAIIRVVPRVERGEQINVGVILSCADTRLPRGANRAGRPTGCWRSIPALDLDAMRTNLAMIPVVCRGGPRPDRSALLPPRGRFRWLVSPRSTIIQMSAGPHRPHHRPGAALDRLLETMVRRPGSSA